MNRINLILKYNIEENIGIYVRKYLADIKLYFILFIFGLVAYGQKLFFTVLASDDYARYYTGGGEQASWLGRWMGGVLNQNVFTGALHVLPYFNGVLGVFSFTLAGFLTAKFLRRDNVFDVVIITFLVSLTPMVAHNLYFNTNVSVWVTTLLGVIGILMAYKHNKAIKIIGFIFLVIAIGVYQTIVQVSIGLIVIRGILKIIESKDTGQIKRTMLELILYIVFVLFAFILSNIANYIYIEYNNLQLSGRFERSGKILDFEGYISRIKGMYIYGIRYHLKLLYFKDTFILLYKITILFSIAGIVYYTFVKNSNIYVKVISLSLAGLLYLLVPFIMNLPLITGSHIPLRAHFTIGWLVAGFFVVQSLVYTGVFRTVARLLAISIIIVNVYYISVFFDAGSRQTSADIVRVNQIVNRIRTNKNYTTEPMKYKIIGDKSFPVTGWKSDQQGLNTDWSRYAIFKNFTDFKFKRMNPDEYQEIVNILVKNGKKVNEYPENNSIFVYGDKAVLFLETKSINEQIVESKL